MRASFVLLLVFTACGSRTGLVVEDPPSDAKIDALHDTTAEDTRSDGSIDDAPADARVDAPVIDAVVEDAVVLPPTGAADVSVGGSVTCVRTLGGRVRCFGANTSGEVGDATTAARLAPTLPIASLENVTQVATGLAFACARLGDATVRCWGQTRNGVLGDGVVPGPERTLVPRAIPDLADVAEIAAGADVCARLTDGRVFCWGACSEGDCPTKRPIAAPIARIRQIATAWLTRCAVDQDDRVLCWGGNESGQLGNGTRVSRTTPAVVMTGVRRIAMGGGPASPFSHESGVSVCALKLDDSVWCWGRRMTLSGTEWEVLRPEHVEGFSGKVIEVATSGPLSCAREADGRVECWGYSTKGAIGIPDAHAWTTPRVLPGLANVTAIAMNFDRVAVVRDGVPFGWGAPLVGDGSALQRDIATAMKW